jgi:hypothetical protein
LTFTAFGYSNNQREATLITKCEVAKAKTPKWVMGFTSKLQGR